MGCGAGSAFSGYSVGNTCFPRQEDAAANAANIRSDGSADGSRRCRCVAGIADACLVGLSALVSADTAFVYLLVPVSFILYVEEDAVAHQYFDTGG